MKHDIENNRFGLDFIRSLLPVTYRMNDGNGKLDMGFIAQEVEAAVKARVGEMETNLVVTMNDEQGIKMLRYNDLISPVVKAVQEISDKLDQLWDVLSGMADQISLILEKLAGHDRQIQDLEKQNGELRRMIQDLKGVNDDLKARFEKLEGGR